MKTTLSSLAGKLFHPLAERAKHSIAMLSLLIACILLAGILISLCSKPQPAGISTDGYAYIEAHEQYVLYRKESTGDLYMFVRSATSPRCYIANFKLAEDGGVLNHFVAGGN